MDEPFHVPQAQAYCAGNWTYWDDKITTPPGLYIYSVGIQRLTGLACSVSFLRMTCTLLLLTVPTVLTRLLSTNSRRPCPRSLLSPTLEATVIASFPILWFFSFLYYTEVPSLVLIVSLSFYAQQGKHVTAALLGLLACTVRQTNILWVLYAFAYSQLSRFQHASRETLHDPPFPRAKMSDLPLATLSLLKNLPTILYTGTPYLALTFLFTLFVILNGGIVLGDKSNHTPVLHIPQLYYFYAFAAILGWPVMAAVPGGPFNLAKEVKRMLFGTLRSTTLTTLLLAFIGYSIQRFTIHHPFLLSDNRHYTFYVWHRFFLVHPQAPLIFTPLYLLCFCAWCIRVGNGQTLMQTVLLPLLLVPLLIPTPLLEPRYFLIPYVFLRSQVVGMPRWGLILEGFWYATVNAITMYIFLYAERSNVGRFMW